MQVKLPLKNSTDAAPENFTIHNLPAYFPEEHPFVPTALKPNFLNLIQQPSGSLHFSKDDKSLICYISIKPLSQFTFLVSLLCSLLRETCIPKVTSGDNILAPK